MSSSERPVRDMSRLPTAEEVERWNEYQRSIRRDRALKRKPLARIPLRSRASRKIYFIHCKLTGRVKCGIAHSVLERLSMLQTGSPTILRLIASFDGDRSREKAIHTRLSRWRCHGEWFQYVDEVREIIIEETTAHVEDRFHGLYVARTKLRDSLPAPHTPP